MPKEDKISAIEWLNSAEKVYSSGKKVTWPNIIKILDLHNIIVEEKPSSSKVGYSKTQRIKKYY